MQKAGFFSRFIALFIDGIAISILAFIVIFVFGGIAGLTARSNSDIMALIGGTPMLLMMVIMLLFQFL